MKENLLISGCLILLFTVFLVFTSNVAAADDVVSLIDRAGNLASDAERLEILKQIRDLPDIDGRLQADCERLISEIDKWLHDPRLTYFWGQLRRQGEYSFGITEDSPLYPIVQLYQVRMKIWLALESGSIWSSDENRTNTMTRIRSELEQLRSRFPRNQLIAMYLGEPIPWQKDYASAVGAPQWAVYQRDAIERLADIINWWIDNRMQADGQYGGGWGDDCEMWRWWMPVLIGFDDPKIKAAQERFSRALLSQSHMAGGYTNRMTDVEHTAEDAADAITPMMLLDPENPEWQKRALRLVELMKNLWTGVNERGFLQFRSTYFTCDAVDTTIRRACDTVYHPRAIQPALLYWQRTGDKDIGNLVTKWLDTWVDATARAERGKPAGIIPSAIHWPEGYIGGITKTWWDPGNHTDDPLYVWPSAMSMMTNSLLLAYFMTEKDRYLEPIRSMAKIRLQAITSPQSSTPEIGSIEWCGLMMRGISDVVSKLRLLTGEQQFDDLIIKDASPYMRYRLSGDREVLTDALRQTASALQVDFPGYTSEVRYTDRCLRFPQLFSRPVMYPDPLPGRYTPDTELIFSTLTGEHSDGLYFPVSAVRWLTPPRDIAALVNNADEEVFYAELYHFGLKQRPMKAELYLLKEGDYEMLLTASDTGKVLRRDTIAINERRSRISFELPSQRLCRLQVLPVD